MAYKRKTDTKTDEKTDAKKDTKTDAKTDTKTDAKTDTKTDEKTDVKTDTKTDTKTESPKSHSPRFFYKSAVVGNHLLASRYHLFKVRNDFFRTKVMVSFPFLIAYSISK